MTGKHNHKTRFFFSFVSVLLIVSLLSASYGYNLGTLYAYDTTYISEVQIFGGDTLDSAIKSCEESGFIAVKKNINHSAEGEIKDNGIYVAGYKTTRNPDEAITDISMLQMNNGYQDYTYGDIAERAIEKLGNIPTELSYAAEELTARYKEQSPAAIASVHSLNCYHVDELENIKLGDYIVSDDFNVDFIKKILSRSSTSVVSTFCNSLAAGVADYGDENWATRLEASTVKNEIKSGNNNQLLDVKYKVLATELVSSLQAFSNSYNNAVKRYEENNNKLSEIEDDTKKSTEISAQTVTDKTTGGEIKSENGDAMYLCAYDMLNTYNYDETTKLGDYIVSLGNSSYDEIANLRKIYPLVDSLTDGQVATMRLSGVAFAAIYLSNDKEIIEETDKQLEPIIKEIKEYTGSDSMSIWIGTDQTVYKQKVAVTSKAYRANSAGQIYNTLTSPDGVDTFLSEAKSKLELIQLVVGVGWIITCVTAVAINAAIGFSAAYVGVSSSVWAICCAGIGAGAVGSILGVIGCAFIILNYIAFAALIVVLIALLVKYLWDLFTDDDAEEFSSIPTVIFDESQNRYVRYDVVTQGGSPANINGDNARRWNALYTTKSKYAGDPICASSIYGLITVQYDNNVTPQGYRPVKCFGEVAAANLNANSKSDSSSVYMFCKTTTNEINEGEAAQTDGEQTNIESGVQYISKLSLSVESSETAAKTALTKSGYNVLDINLTPVTASLKKYTYLGYTTTTNSNDAVTDIRISPRNSSSAYLFGNASYTSCGTTPTGDTLYYTSYKSAGSPILADILVKYSLNDVPEGYEPINMFCGGNAYNLNVGSEIDNTVSRTHRSQTYEHWNDKGTYLYFKPSVSYTDGEEYISGIVLVAGNGSGKLNNSADDYINALKLKKIDQSLTHAARLQLPTEAHGMASEERWSSNVETYICYTTTHNPYRAIYGIKSYTSAPGNTTVPVYLGTATNGSYAVCDVMFELPYLVSGGSSREHYLRGIYETHSYQFANSSGTLTGLEQKDQTTELEPEDYEDVEWTSCNVRGKGLYVLGPVTGGTPLTVNDFVVTSEDTAPDGYVSIQDFKTPNRTKPHNLGYLTKNSKYISYNKKVTPVYIYQKMTAPVKKKYISSISVSTYNIKKAVGNDLSKYDSNTQKLINATGNDYCIQNLLAQCTDEIIQVDLANEKSQTFYSNPSSVNDKASYIGVSRTDSELEAITGIIRYVTDKTDVSSTIQVGGVTYIKAGDMITDRQCSYYLYYTTSAGTSPGMPITELSVSTTVFDGEKATALTTNSVDVSALKSGTTTTRQASTASLYGDPDEIYYIHMSYKDTATMMGAVYIGHGKTVKEAQCNLLNLGCNICVDMDINSNTGGEYIYIGYTRYTLLPSEVKKGVAKRAVRDIILTVGQPHQKELVINGVTYKSAIDEYTSVKDYDGVKAVSLNTGTGGKQIYLYYSITKTKDTAYPIAKLGLARKDYGVINDDSNTWEHIFDTNGNRVNLNEGAIATIDDGKHITDNRIYLYASRTDNAYKTGCRVDMNYLLNEFYDVYMKGA